LVVSLFLIYIGFDIARDAVDDLIGKPPATEEIETIRNIVTRVDGVLGVHDITVHSYGQDKFISIHIEIDADKSTAEAHDISEEVEDHLKNALGVEPTVHLDPVSPGNPLVKQVQEFLNQNWSNEDSITDIHDIRIVETKNHHVILFGINVKVGISQKHIVECCQSLENDLKNRFTGFEINIKVSPMHHY